MDKQAFISLFGPGAGAAIGAAMSDEGKMGEGALHGAIRGGATEAGANVGGILGGLTGGLAGSYLGSKGGPIGADTGALLGGLAGAGGGGYLGYQLAKNKLPAKGVFGKEEQEEEGPKMNMAQNFYEDEGMGFGNNFYQDDPYNFGAMNQMSDEELDALVSQLYAGY